MTKDGEYAGNQCRETERIELFSLHTGLFTRVALQLMHFLGRDYEKQHHTRELARCFGYSASTISKSLKALSTLDLVTCERRGNLTLYQANMENVLLREMKICFTLLELHALIGDLKVVSSQSILFGSCARGEDTERSDIDLYIVTLEREQARRTVQQHQQGIRRRIAPIFNTPEEVYTLKTENRALYDNIQRGIVIAEGHHGV